MPQEIERKFEVKGDYKKYAVRSHRIRQGYLSMSPFPTVRIRISDDKAYITIKGKATANGLSRYEWEKEIPTADAEELLLLSIGYIVEKVRYIVPFNGKNFEVDEFLGDNEGLTVAELELEYETETFDRPDWLGNELTGDKTYNNSYLAQHPYKNREK